MSATALRPLLALREGLSAVRRQPRLALGFSALTWTIHLLGWALFAAGHDSSSAVLAVLLHGLGSGLYLAGLIWLIEGLTRLGLALSAGRTLGWPHLCRWHGRQSRHLVVGLLNTGLALAATALAGFMSWSLVLFLLPALSSFPALLGLLAMLAMGLSQLFNPCLVLEEQLSPSRAFGRGVDLLVHHWRGLLGLTPVLLAILLLPFALGLLAEVVGAGLGVAITALAMVAAFPLLATTVTAAYRQISGTAFTSAAR